MIDETEVDDLARKYGEPLRHTFDLEATGTILTHRWRIDSDRRAEVIFAIQGPGEQLWLHTKHSYPRPMFRLPSGGIDWDETVVDALFREIEEETRLPVIIQRFVALVTYRFHRHAAISHRPTTQFASYLFWLQNINGSPKPGDNEEVADFKPILPSQLPEVVSDLRNIWGDRRSWGQWRALAHDVLFDYMKSGVVQN
ncbi:NUDIX hydrolase [Chloroflexi bacterium TSY]|nr:NUDIX hydrolase [Chloroflexi bacterium TSY]